jgi:2-phosphosulfolactate phosphatase
MKITRSRFLSGAENARGTAVVIDVYRAFSCTSLLFAMGIESSLLVATAAEAFALKKKDPGLVLIGESGGAPIDGFDFGNSPSWILNAGPRFFAGKTVVQRTSSGVQAAIAAMASAAEVLLGSYGVAESTARYILSRKPDEVSLVAAGWNLEQIAPEDEGCARYLAHLLGAGDYDHFQALRDIIFHETTQKFLRADVSYFPPEDPLLCLQSGICDFALRAERSDSLVSVDKIPA